MAEEDQWGFSPPSEPSATLPDTEGDSLAVRANSATQKAFSSSSDKKIRQRAISSLVRDEDTPLEIVPVPPLQQPVTENERAPLAGSSAAPSRQRRDTFFQRLARQGAGGAGGAHGTEMTAAVKEVNVIEVFEKLIGHGGQEGVAHQERRQGEHVFTNCFIGAEAVSFMVENGYAQNRELAVLLGKRMMRCGLLEHVQHRFDFEDQVFFYYRPIMHAPMSILHHLLYDATDESAEAALTTLKRVTSAYRAATKFVPNEAEVQLLWERRATARKNIEEALVVGTRGADADDVDAVWGEQAADGSYGVLEYGLRHYLQMEGKKIFFLCLYSVICIIMGVDSFIHYRHHPSFALLGSTLLLSRTTAALINIQAMIMLLPVSRNFMSYLHSTILQTVLPLGKNITMHKLCARVMFICAILHTAGHLKNASLLAATSNNDLRYKYGINLPDDRHRDVAGWLFTTVPGLTGIFLLILLLVICLSSFRVVRHRKFHIWWNVHQLWVLFYALLISHGTSHLLGPARSWAYVLFPLTIMVAEWSLRVWRGSQRTTVIAVYEEQSGVIRIDFSRKNFRYKPGQYVFLNCPTLSNIEWHPFSITSSPDQAFVSLHIKRVGDWTEKLRKYLNPLGRPCVDMNTDLDPDNNVMLRVDGPFGTPSEHVFEFEEVLLIGAGIGVTPFASVLRMLGSKIMAREQSASCCSNVGAVDGRGAAVCKCRCPCCSMRVRKVHFYWSIREITSFEWFADLLVTLEQQVPHGFLELNIYLTGAKPEDRPAPREDGLDPITGLKTATMYGRADWESIFRQHATSSSRPGREVGVFFCGPSGLSKVLYGLCRKSSEVGGTSFKFNKEVF